MSCHEVTVDKDADDSRHVQHGCRSEWMVNEPLDGVLKRIGRHHHGAPPFSQGDAVGSPDPTARCGLNCRAFRIPQWERMSTLSIPRLHPYIARPNGDEEPVTTLIG